MQVLVHTTIQLIHLNKNSLLNGGWKFGAVAWKVQAGGSTVTPPVGRTVYVAGKDSKVY
ncbi:hypothetical protein ICE98_01325 [Lactococcus lactis]|nr:hypothetical protein [Lactococcus lactis]